MESFNNIQRYPRLVLAIGLCASSSICCKIFFFLKNTYVSVSSLCFCINYVVYESSQYITRLVLCRHVILGDLQDLYTRYGEQKSVTRDRVDTVLSNYTIYLSYTCIWLMYVIFLHIFVQVFYHI